MYPRRSPRRGRHRVFALLKESRLFFKFWSVDADLFKDVEVCPISACEECRNIPIDVVADVVAGVYVNKRIYLNDTRKRTFFHIASYHVIRVSPVDLYDVHGQAVKETVADIAAAAAVELSDVPRGVGWSLIEEAERGPCREVWLYRYLGPRLSDRCILTQIKYRPDLLLRLFSEPTFF